MKGKLKKVGLGALWLFLPVVLTLAVLLGLNPRVSIGQAGQGTPIRSYAALIACSASLDKMLIHVPGSGLHLCDQSGNPGIWGPITEPNQIPAGYGNCAVLDFAICTSAVSAGNPSYISAGANGDLTINGAGLVVFIKGQYQTGTGTYTNAITGLSASTFYYVYVQKDVANANFVAADFGATNLPPVYSYTAPTACTGASSTNPSLWFDMTARQWQISTAAACSYSVASAQVLFLGVVHMNATPAMDAVAHEPYNLSPYRRYELFGDGFDAVNAGTDTTFQHLTSGTTTINNWHTYASFQMTGATVNPTSGANNGTANGFIMISSQNPILVINSSVLSVTGFGRAGPAGGTGVGSAGSTIGWGGSSGAGGGSSTNAGGNGAGRPQYPGTSNNAGTPAGGGVNTVGASSNSTPTGPLPFCNLQNYIALAGATGGAGGGDGTNAGGAGGSSGGELVVRAPSIVEDAGSSITANGGNGSNGAAGNAGGGGAGGGGLEVLSGGFLTLSGTKTASAGTRGTGVGTGGNGGTAAAGAFLSCKLW